ncbi:MAG TPA: 1-(5-phosphoribosyl)-5-((5-phosphoribosylamino)methylideneamino)imidazole-4-carboxamide isomerase, partial [Coriobacteriia bacterium]|nr:1-(5-phosphoribosyl)-5-((5-phosphoribosylamino)methylideneamino)imidazole-4-carboxamide isomerase [Coriobacteriia bacterium]
MELFPAIDLLDGKVVRLAQGSYEAVTEYNDDPVKQALLFKEQGANWIHVVDLNGARSGEATNTESIKAIIETSGLKVEVGG